MAVSAADVSAKHDQLQAAVADLDSARDEYESTKTPYVEAKQALVAAIDRVDVLDNELEALVAEYEPPAKPESA